LISSKVLAGTDRVERVGGEFLVHLIILEWGAEGKGRMGACAHPGDRRAGAPRRYSLLLRVQEFHVQAEAPHFLDEHVEAFRHAGLEIVLALDDGLVDLGAARHVVGLDREHLLQV
jgi:hypothetical protein